MFRWAFKHVVSYEGRRDIPETITKREDVIVRQRVPDDFRQGADDLPVFPRCTRWWDGDAAELTATLGVDPRCRFLSVSCARQADVCKLGTEVTVVALVDYERVLGDRSGVNLVGVEEVDELWLDV